LFDNINDESTVGYTFKSNPYKYVVEMHKNWPNNEVGEGYAGVDPATNARTVSYSNLRVHIKAAD
jgi:hypothetical protein